MLVLAPACYGASSVEGTPRLRVFGIRPIESQQRAATAKLDGALAEIAALYPQISAAHPLASLHTINPALRFRLATPSVGPEVLLDATTTGDPQLLKRALAGLGLRDIAVYANDVGGWLPVGRLAAAAQLAPLHQARAAIPLTRSGGVATQGDYVQGSSSIRAQYPSLSGAGIKVGILSDSFNCYQTYANNGLNASGLNGYASNGYKATYSTDQSTGALPAGISILEEAPCLEYGAPEQLPFTDEGRAILQIVHVVAPDATLAFHTASNSEADFAQGIVDLAAAGAKIIDDDVGYQDEPFFQDGIIALAVDQVAAQGVAYFSSAGNEGHNSYENTAPVFPVTATTAPNSGEQLLNFDPTGASTTTSMPLTIPALFPGEFVSLVVEWDQPYVTGAPSSGGATSSIDLCVISATGADQISDPADFPTAVTCTGPNAIGNDPVQIIYIGNPADASGSTAVEQISIAIGLANGTPAPSLIKLLLAGDGAAVSIDAFATNSPTIQGHPSAAGAAAVGAAFYFDTPACGTAPALIESYSSLGGDPILFDSSGTRLAAPQVRQKPQFTGPDGVNNTFLGFNLNATGMGNAPSGCKNNGAYPSFFGTSAAAPHAAAAAALLWQANPAVSAAQIVAALQSSALPMGGGVSFSSGYGFIQTNAALALLPPAPPTLSLNPATIALGGSSQLSWSSISTSACVASGSWSGNLAPSGSQSVSPAAVGGATYTLTCSGAAGQAANS
ncbi:MAG TPA: S8 family serine peptidase, partial [Steroidobacteraceae bacterium]|nr:S8 family serine peptidase [Steroidobacteraceae bacterium]